MADKRFSQAMSEGLMQQGLTKLGSISAVGKSGPVANAIVGAAQETAAKAVEAMRMRYWQEEYKQFSKAYVEPAKEQMEMISQQFEMETKVANRVIAFPRSQAQVQEDANEARRQAPGPETDAKKDGPAGLMGDGDGGFEYDERPAMLNQESGQPIPMGTMEANDHIRASMGKAMSGNRAVQMKLMDSFAEFPNNPMVQQAAAKMFEGLQQQLAFAATGKADAMEAGRYMDEREMHEAEVEERQANTAGMKGEEGRAQSGEQSRKAKEVGNQRAQVSMAAQLMDAGLEDYYGDDLKKKMQGNWEDMTPEDMNALGAINRVAQEAHNKQVEAGLATQKESQFMNMGPDVDFDSVPAQIRGSKPYDQFLGETMQPVMTELQRAWNENAPGYRASLNAPEHIMAEDASSQQVGDFLLQHAAATHPDRELDAAEQTWDFAYQTDKRFANRVEQEVTDSITRGKAAGKWHSGKEALFQADPTGFARAYSLKVPYQPKPGTRAATIWRNTQVQDELLSKPLAPYEFGPPEGGQGMLTSRQGPAPAAKAAAPVSRSKPAGPAHAWLKDKIGTGHPASQETNTPAPRTKKTIKPHTKDTQPTDTKAKKAKKADKPASKGSQSTDSKKGAKPAKPGSPRLKVKGPGDQLAAPPKVEIPKPRTKVLGKVSIDPSRLRNAVAAPPNVKSLEDFIKGINEGLGAWSKSHKEKASKYKSRFDTGTR